MKKILEGILNTFRPLFTALLFDMFCRIFRKIKPVEKLASVLQTLYIPVDKELESLAAETTDKNDDALVSALKNAIETIAGENNIELQNTDND